MSGKRLPGPVCSHSQGSGLDPVDDGTLCRQPSPPPGPLQPSPRVEKSQAAWVREADEDAARTQGLRLPPAENVPLQQIVTAAWHAFQYLNRARKGHPHDTALACAEHYAYARAVVCAGGPVVYPLMVGVALYYDVAKWALDKVNLRQLLDANLDGSGFVTASSPEQVKAARDGADAGLALHFAAFR